jgi:diguanylate cyclase (GGDEF)-like protein
MGKNCRFLNGLNRDQAEIKTIHDALVQNTPVQCTVQNFKKDGTPFWNLLTISPIKDQHGSITHFIGIQRDVTKAMDTAEQLRRLNAELVATNQILEERVVQRTADLERLATTDPLTGVFNRRYWMKRAEVEIASARRQSAPLSIVMLDIDYFKRINDKFGHPVGDLVLVRLCEEVQKILRLEDTFARFGGEEFVLLLPRADVAFATQIAERIRVLLASMVLAAADKTSFSFTASLGVATLSPADQNIDSLLASVDAALYRAKNAGRNRVMAASANSS